MIVGIIIFIVIAGVFAVKLWHAPPISLRDLAPVRRDADIQTALIPPDPPKRRYVSRKSVLTPGEIEFHRVLMKAAPEAAIFPKVRVADVMNAAERYSGDFLRISQKHFDWIVCHPVTFEPLIAVELDDSSHQGFKQQKNDRVKNEAAAEAGITLLRFRWSRFYDEEEVRGRIAEVINRIADQKEAATSPAATMTSPQAIAANVTAALAAEAKVRRI